MKWKNPELLPMSSIAQGDLNCSPTGSSAATDCSTGVDAVTVCHTGHRAATCDANGTSPD